MPPPQDVWVAMDGISLELYLSIRKREVLSLTQALTAPASSPEPSGKLGPRRLSFASKLEENLLFRFSSFNSSFTT